MDRFALKRTAACIRAIAVPFACGALVSCATDYVAPVDPVSAAPAAVTAPQPPSYYAFRASDLIGRPLRNARGDYLGQISDIVLDMSTGDVRYAVIGTAPPGVGRLYLVPARSFVARSGSDMALDITPAELTRYQSWRPDQWPAMRDTAFWNDIDRASGFPVAHTRSYYDRWSELVGRTVYDASGDHLGQLRDLVINMATDRVHYAVVSFAPGVAAADRYYAVPLYAFVAPRDQANRLVLSVPRARIAQLESFDAYHWPQINEPAYVTRIERYFVNTFPISEVASFDQLDANHDGFLSKAELAPLGFTTDAGGRYVATMSQSASAAFHRLDVDHDGFLTRNEAQPSISAATFDRFDTNRDGFLSIGEATPALGSAAGGTMLSFDQLDRDRDGFLTRAEAAPLFGSTVVTVHHRPVVYSFDAVDTNHDGFISPAEAQAALGANALTFNRYDANRDGFLSRAEADPLLRSGVGASGVEVMRGTVVAPR